MSQTQKPSTISNLQSQSDRDLLDLIDKLRSDGVCRYIDLPRIVVCGDQSSGKSSVLEAISGRSFPVDGGTCTRFPTELILRCHPIKSIRASIEPDLNRDEDDKKRLASFKDRDFDPLDDLSKIIAEAKSLLGFNGNDDDPAIVEDILRISISGPDQPHLTMVDLPGLMANKADDKQEKAIEKIQTLVMKYISQPRAIILAVISAKSDFMLQTVTNYTTAVDRNGERTFGLITKPDAMDIGPVEKSYIRIIKNEAEPRLRLGWHVLRNRSDKERDSTISERDKVESEFFRQGVWPSINTDHLGIAKLRLRLSDSLKEQIIQQLPVVIQDLEKFIKDARLKLDSLGPDRGSLDEQECYLNEVEDRFSQLLKAAVDGNHEDSFFHDESVDNGGDGRLRATILNLQDSFDNTMRTEGHAKKIIDRTEKKSGVPRSIYRDDYSKEVQGILKSHRGRELPGTTNHNAVTALFRKQTQPWAKIINNHMTLVIAASYRAVDNMIRYVADENTANGILKHLDGNKKKLTQQVKSKISEIQWSNLHSHPITTNPSFIRDLWETQRFAHEQSIRLALQMYTKNKTNIIEANVEDIIYAVSNMKEEAEMEYHASLQAIYAMEAYYKVHFPTHVLAYSALLTKYFLDRSRPNHRFRHKTRNREITYTSPTHPFQPNFRQKPLPRNNKEHSRRTTPRSCRTRQID